MRVEIRIAADPEHIRAGIPGTNHQLVEPNRVAVSRDRRRLRLEAVGAGAKHAPAGTSKGPAYDPTAFDPDLTANVIEYLRLLLLSSRSRPLIRDFGDRLNVRLTLAGYERIPSDARAKFEAALPRHRTAWWINNQPLA